MRVEAMRQTEMFWRDATAIACRDESYAALMDKLGARQRVVYDTLAHCGPMSNAEIARTLCVGVNQITGRVFELRELGLVESTGTGMDARTNRKVTLWGLKQKEVEP
jgi:predicted transcriptional regulator